MFESKVPLCLSGEFIAQPKPGQTSNDRAETSPEGGVASTAPLPGGETASGRVGRCDDQRPLTRWGEELGAPGMVINRLNCLAPVLSRAPSPFRPIAHSPFRLFAVLRFSLFARKYAVESVFAELNEDRTST